MTTGIRAGDTIRYCAQPGCKGLIVNGMEGPVCSECGFQPEAKEIKPTIPISVVQTGLPSNTPAGVKKAPQTTETKGKRGGSFKPKHIFIESHKAEIIQDYQALSWAEVVRKWDLSDSGLRTIFKRWEVYKPGPQGGRRPRKKESVVDSLKAKEVVETKPQERVISAPEPPPNKIAYLEARIKKLEEYILMCQKILIMEWTKPGELK